MTKSDSLPPLQFEEDHPALDVFLPTLLPLPFGNYYHSLDLCDFLLCGHLKEILNVAVGS